jgi:CheY-like chemotaxis protein
MESDIAVNGLKAVEMVADSEYDVIFMDLQMPVMDGFEATKCLKKQEYAGPIIAVTADSESGARERCLELGMVDVVLKPVKVSDIQSSLEVLQGLNARQVI